MANKLTSGIFGLGLAALVSLLDPIPVIAQDGERAPMAQEETESAEDQLSRAALRARSVRDSLQTLLSDDRTGSIVPGALGDPNYSGLFQVSRVGEEELCFMQRGSASGGTETFRGREASPFEDGSTFINLYKEFTTVGHLTGVTDVDARIRIAVTSLHTQVWNQMYAGGEQAAQDSDWELTWQNGELMGIQVRQDRARPLRDAVREYARTLPTEDHRRRSLSRAGVFSRHRHAYWTNGEHEVCLGQEYLVPRNPVREVVRIEQVEVPVQGAPAPVAPVPTGCIDEVLDALARLERGQGHIRDDIRNHDMRILARLDVLESQDSDEERSFGRISVVGGLAHQWVSLHEVNNGGNYSYLADATGGIARLHFNGSDFVFSLSGEAYTGTAVIDGVSHGTLFHGGADGIDVVGNAGIAYLPWDIAGGLRIGVGGDIAFNVRDLHNVAYQTGGEEVRDQTNTEIFGALAPGIMLSHNGDITTFRAFIGLGPAFEHRTDSDGTYGRGYLVGRLRMAFQAGDNFIPYIQADGTVNFSEHFVNSRVGGEAGILVHFGDFVIGPSGSITYRRAQGEGFSRDSLDYQVALVTGFQTGGHNQDGGHNQE